MDNNSSDTKQIGTPTQFTSLLKGGTPNGIKEDVAPPPP